MEFYDTVGAIAGATRRGVRRPSFATRRLAPVRAKRLLYQRSAAVCTGASHSDFSSSSSSVTVSEAPAISSEVV